MIRWSGGLLFLLILIAWPGNGLCFYEYRQGDSELELYGFLGAGIGQLTYPADSVIVENRDDQAWSGDLRLMMDADYGDSHLSANLLQSSRSKIPFVAPVAHLVPLDVARSSVLTWEQHDSGRVRSELVADTFHLQLRSSRLDLTAGRQPINLATTFYFTPNDFFAPFAPQTFFRNYKPGVDGLRGDFRLSELSQLTMIGVLAYEVDSSTANGWSRSPDWSETALLLRISREIAGFGWTVLAGSVNDSKISGASLQGELFRGIGLRAEGHYAAPETSGGNSHYKLAAGLEKLYANNFSWRLEYLRNSGGGLANLNQVPGAAAGNRDYAALGFGWEFSPLLTGSLLGLAALDDDSRLFTGNLLYSLSNESELSLIISIPSGDSSGTTTPGSEFGNQPRLALLEYRFYF